MTASGDRSEPSEEFGSGAGEEDRIARWADRHREEAAAYLLELIEIETPTEAPETFEAFFGRLTEDLEAVDLRTKRYPGEETGGRLEARLPAASSTDGADGDAFGDDPGDAESGAGEDAIQLVLGHADTVWPLGTIEENHPERRNDGDRDVVTGPGSLDMKGGLTQAVFALGAIEALSLEPSVPVHVLVSSDEEIGSPESKSHIEDLARRANRVFVLEPASGPEGKLKVARKAVGRYTVTITGKAAHAGIEPEEGASAIEELGSIIQRLHAFSDAESGVTVNVGQVEAGFRSNVVAPGATAKVDVRAPTEETVESIDEQIRSLEATTPGTELSVEGGFGRPPMEQTPGNRLLWEQVRSVGRRMGLDLKGAHSGGASDGNNASQYAPTIDGFGAVGDGAHQSYEYVDVDALVDRIALLTACLIEEPLPAGPHEEVESNA